MRKASKKEKRESEDKPKKKATAKKKEKDGKSEKMEKLEKVAKKKAKDGKSETMEKQEKVEMEVGPNPCSNKNPMSSDVQCIRDGIELAGEQSGVNVTKGYKGNLETDASPITKPFSKVGLCPVNVSRL